MIEFHDGSGSFSAYISEQNKSLHIVEIFRQTGLFKNWTKYNVGCPLLRRLSLFKKIKSQKDKFGLRPFEPSSFSSVAPRSLLPENFLLFDSSPLKLLPFATPWPPWGWGRRRSSQLRRFIKKVGGTSSLVNSSSLFSSVTYIKYNTAVLGGHKKCPKKL